MQFTLTIDTKTCDANTLGEYLRGQMFTNEGYGCYSNFNINPNWTETVFNEDDFYTLWGRKAEREQPENAWGYSDEEVFTDAVCYVSPEGIRGCYYWDGDGSLGFTLPDGTRVSNSDCKKDNNWTFVGE